MRQLEIEFFKDAFADTIVKNATEKYPEINYSWLPMRIFIGDKIEDYIKKETIDKE